MYMYSLVLEYNLKLIRTWIHISESIQVQSHLNLHSLSILLVSSPNATDGGGGGGGVGALNLALPN